VCYSSRAFRKAIRGVRYSNPFGFPPKISTPVENTVEKQVKRLSHCWKALIFRDFRPGESP